MHAFGRPNRLALLGIAIASAAVGCGGAVEETGGAGGGGATGEGGSGGAGPAICDAHATSGAPVFEDQTAAWGLSSVVGIRAMSADLDGDGYPDLIVHGLAANVRETIGEGDKRVFLLMNEPAEGGGRTFVDRTYESGFAVPADGSTTELKSSQFAVVGDVDNDGDLDIFSGTYSDQPAGDPTPADLDRSEIYLNDGAGHFDLLPDSGVELAAPKRTSSATFVDYNLDGVLDLFVGIHYTATGSLQAPLLYRGNGDGTFEDVTSATKVNKQHRATFGVASCDLDDDGLTELMMAAYARGPNVLYHWQDGAFEDVGVESGFAYDDLTDYHDNQFFKCWCTVHDTDPDCAGVGSPNTQCPTPADSYWSPTFDTDPERLGGNTFSLVCADIDGDEKLDVYHADIAHWWAGESSDKSDVLLNTSEGKGSFSFESVDREQAGLLVPHVGGSWNEGGITAAVADLDGDARNDIILGTSDYPDQFGWVFLQRDPGAFEESGEALGIHHPCAVGVTVADFDRDGDLDVVFASGTARDCADIWATNEVHFYENGGQAENGWLAVRLKGTGGSNASAIGARVTVEAGGVRQLQQLTSGYGHFGMQNDTVLFFSLGTCTEAAKVEIVWPDDTRSKAEIDRVAGGRVVEIVQGDDTVHDI